ncbi:MAG: flagellar motor switch protein FliM [Acidobacteria bacterium]|nr:flagellar motor switch protein FliM [Acidobacteriota bacterium]
MSKILSQDEIDALLTSTASQEPRAPGGRPLDDGSVVVYNFRRPDRVNREQIRSLQFLHDRFARNISTSLSAYLRTVTDVNVTSVEQFTYSEFLMSLPDPTAFYAISLSPIEGLAALELNPAVAFSMIDRMLGGTGRGMAPTRGLTEIEHTVIDGVVKLILEHLTETWRNIVEVRFRVNGRETRPQMLQVAAPNEVVVLVGFDIKVGDTRGMLHFCLPATVIESVGDSFTHTWYRSHREPTVADREQFWRTLGHLPVGVAATVETTMLARDVLEFAPGDVIALGHRLSDPLQVRIHDTVKFEAHPVSEAGRAGVRLLNTVSSPTANHALPEVVHG